MQHEYVYDTICTHQIILCYVNIIYIEVRPNVTNILLKV